MDSSQAKLKTIESYFFTNSKRQKVDRASENVISEIACGTRSSRVETADPVVNRNPLASSKCKSSWDIQESSCNLEIISPLKWRAITAENLCLEYTKIFSRQQADQTLQRLEKEVVYFTGDLLKVKIFGKWHQIPRKQVSFGDPGLSYKFSGNCIPALEWTPLMLELKNAVEKVTSQKFNFVLVNRYKDGMDNMGEHRDDEKDLVPGATIASLSFGQHRDFIFKHKDSRGTKATRKIDPVKLVLEHGSLLLMKFPTNDFWYHSLPIRKNATNVRVNLTFRNMVNKNVA